MAPLTAQSGEGRVLLALRAGPMTPAELAERFGSSGVVSPLVKSGLVGRTDGDEGGEYRITEAGRAACPYRNPLAAPGAVKPITIKEAPMPRGNSITRNDVLNAILTAGAHGITRPALIEQFNCAGVEARLDMHTSKLVHERPALVCRPRPGFFLAASHVPAVQQLQDSIKQAMAQAPKPELQPAPGFAQGGMPQHTGETIEITAPGNRRAPVVFEDIDIEFAVFSSGRVEISDERHTVVIKGFALQQLREFVGKFEALA